MKKKIRVIIGILIGMIVVSGISVYATLTYTAGDISYTKSGATTPISVSSALNELYAIKKDYIKPSGTKTINTNGTNIDVRQYEKVNVSVNATITKTLLWTNSSPNAAFTAQTVSLNNSLYPFSHILIQWKTDISNSIIYEDLFKIAPYREGCLDEAEYGLIGNNGDGTRRFSRSFAVVDGSTLLRITDSISIAENRTNNNKIIPVYIYGLNFSY